MKRMLDSGDEETDNAADASQRNVRQRRGNAPPEGWKFMKMPSPQDMDFTKTDKLKKLEISDPIENDSSSEEMVHVIKLGSSKRRGSRRSADVMFVKKTRKKKKKKSPEPHHVQKTHNNDQPPQQPPNQPTDHDNDQPRRLNYDHTPNYQDEHGQEWAWCDCGDHWVPDGPDDYGVQDCQRCDHQVCEEHRDWPRQECMCHNSSGQQPETPPQAPFCFHFSSSVDRQRRQNLKPHVRYASRR